MEHNPAQAKERLKRLESDASQMLAELAGLSAKLQGFGAEKAGELGQAALGELGAQIEALQARVQSLGKDGEQLMQTIDKSVRANPYLYIAGALGLGVLLGKVLRS